MVLLQKIKNLFDLNIPIGRLRYFFTYLVLIIILSPLLLVTAPNVIIYESELTLLQAILSGQFQSSEVIAYILIAGILGYAIEFFLDAKRLYDMFASKQTAIIIASGLLAIGIYTEFFVPLNNEAINSFYLIFIFIMFVFMCCFKGKLTQKSTIETEETTEIQEEIQE